MRQAKPALTEEQKKLVEDNMGYAHWWVDWMLPNYPFLQRMLTKQEATAAAYLGLIKTAQYFDKSKGFVFGTLAKRAIFHQVCADANMAIFIRPYATMTDKRSRGVKWLNKRGYGWHPEKDEEEPCKCDPATMEDEEHQEAVFRRVVKCLLSLEKRYGRVLHERFYKGTKLRDLGKVMGVSHQRILQIQITALRKFKERYLREGGDCCDGY